MAAPPAHRWGRQVSGSASCAPSDGNDRRQRSPIVNFQISLKSLSGVSASNSSHVAEIALITWSRTSATAAGWLVLASVASHYYENMAARRPFPIVFHVGDMLDGFDRMRDLADLVDLVVPGHDPEVLRRFPPVAPELAGIACRLA